MGKLHQELAVHNLGLDYDASQACPCVHNPVIHIAWRMFWAIYHSCWLVTGLVMTSLDDSLVLSKYFIYLSNWAYILLTLATWMECVLELRAHRCKSTTVSNRTPTSMTSRITWALSTTAAVGSVMVTLWYWTWIARGKPVTALRLHYHGVNALYALANFLLSRFPFRLLHALYPVALGVAYTAFTAVYFAAGGTNQQGEPRVYKVLDWSRPGRTFALSSLSNFVFIPVVHLLLWLLFLLKERCARRGLAHNRIESVADSESEDRCNGV